MFYLESHNFDDSAPSIIADAFEAAADEDLFVNLLMETKLNITEEVAHFIYSMILLGQ